MAVCGVSSQARAATALSPVKAVPTVRALDASLRGAVTRSAVAKASASPAAGTTGENAGRRAVEQTRTAAAAVAATEWKPLPATAVLPSGRDALYEFAQKLGRQVSKLEDDVLQLREERDVLKAENEVMSEHVYGLQKENSVLHDIGWSSHVEKARLTQVHEGVSSEAAALQQKLHHHGERLQTTFDENQLLRSTVDILKSEKAQLQHAVRGLEAALDSVRADLEQRVMKQGVLEERAAGLERQLEEIAAEKVRLDGLVSTQHVEIASLQQLRADIQAEKAYNQSLTQKLETSDMEISRCYQEKAELDQMVSSLHVEAAQMRTQRDSALAEVPHLNSALQQQNLLMQDLEGQVSALQRDLQSTRDTNGSLETQVKRLSYGLERAREEGSHHEQVALTLRAERSKLQEALQALRTGKAESDARLGAAAGEKGLMQSHFEQINAEREQMQLRIHQAASETGALRSRLAGMEKMAQSYQDESASLQERVASLQDEKAELERRLEQQLLHHAQQRGPPAPLLPPSGMQGGAL